MPMYDDNGRPLKPFRAPINTDPTRLRDIYQAADAQRAAHMSDPFAYGRAVLYMKRGLEIPSDLKAEGDRLARARNTRIDETESDSLVG